MKEGKKKGCTEAGVWVSNPVGDDFRVDLLHVPRAGEVFEIDGQQLKVAAVVYHPLTTECREINKCAVEIVLRRPLVINHPEQLFGTAT
jgi:hypothetical protein